MTNLGFSVQPVQSSATTRATSSVWVADREQRAVNVAVDAGDDRDGQTEIMAGLTGNERVVVNPQRLQQGTPAEHHRMSDGEYPLATRVCRAGAV